MFSKTLFQRTLQSCKIFAFTKKLCVLLSIVFLFTNCRELIQNEFPDFEQVPTINSIITPDSLIELHLSLSNKLSNDSLTVFEDASINLFVNDSFCQKLTYTRRGIYLSDAIVKPMNNYRCELAWENSIILASCFVPQYTALHNVTLNPYAWINMDGVSSPAVEFTINNNPLVEAYFEARITVFEKNIYGSNQPFYYSDAFILDQFTNENEPSSTLSKNFEFQLWSLGSDLEYAYVLELRTISVDYYQYMQSLKLYEHGRFPAFDIGSTAPYNLYSNIENGYGIFAAYASTFSDTLFSN